jgi:sulfite reductase beta subunit-like hemoprotein
LRPASRAYHEIWLDEAKVVTTQEEEPFYGDAYLPRKFKTAIALDSDNCVDIYNHDCGLVAIVENGGVAGFNLLVGGGMGMTHGKPDTIARLAQPIGLVAPTDAVEAVRTVAAIFRDHGNRADRRHARLKYLIQDWGIDRFADEFRRRVSFPLHPAHDLPPPAYHDHLGRHPQGDGRAFYGVFIQNGRIIDRDGELRVKSALREVVAAHRPPLRLTPGQNVLLTDLTDAAIDDIERRLADHGVAPPGDLSAARRYSMACPALPTCGLALAESERLLPSVVDEFEKELESLGLRDAPITLRMTGCPNGCARPYTADIAFVGRRPDVYHVFVGGGLAGDRVADLYAADVPTGDILSTLRPLLMAWAKQRAPDEALGDFYQRFAGGRPPRQQITGSETPTMGTISLPVVS